MPDPSRCRRNFDILSCMSNRQFKVAKFRDSTGATRIGRVDADRLIPLTPTGEMTRLIDLIAADDPIAAAESLSREPAVAADDDVEWLPPIDHQEVWAAGVTYKRSQTARMEESEAAASCYDRVYQADRPELFFKATSHRVCGHRQLLRIRSDATWNVPEPEVTLVLCPKLRIVGLTIGNDMSSRDIEGENPLYLPQAKCYDAAAGLGPWIRLVSGPIERDELAVQLTIRRGQSVVFEATTSAAEMAREFTDLVGWLGRDNSFPDGAVLMTGTGVVPNADFTLQAGDWVDITIDTIGTLSNSIIQG